MFSIQRSQNNSYVIASSYVSQGKWRSLHTKLSLPFTHYLTHSLAISLPLSLVAKLIQRIQPFCSHQLHSKCCRLPDTAMILARTL